MKVKRLFNLGMVIMMLVTSFAVSQPVAAAQAPAKFTPRIPQDAEVMPGEVVVAFADSQDMNLVEKIEQAVDTANDAGGEVTRLSLDGSAVIQVDGDTTAALDELNSQPDVLYAEPNYIFSIPANEEQSTDEYNASSEFSIREVTASANTNGMDTMAVPNSTIEGMMAMGVLPSDTYLTYMEGWSDVGADIVWPNATASANICEVDTGVDYLHPDLWYKYTKVVSGVRRTYYVYRVINGYDFVDGDALPQDDNGHGTHLAGIMVALKNNAMGVSGVSTGNLVAVRALDAQGYGTNFDVGNAIRYCANRTDVRVINLSLGSTAPSASIESALLYATTPTNLTVPGSIVFGKGKLVVAAAGNNGSTQLTYPAAYAADPDFPNNRILSVGATGQLLSSVVNYGCKALFSNYGSWVHVMAPGYNIYSTFPYDKPFYLNYYKNRETRYDFMSGTSQAAAFVSAAAARRMGYKPTETNETVGGLLVNTGNAMNNALGTSCTPAEISTVKRVNVATLLDRAGVRVSVSDAITGVGLNGATVAVQFLNDGVSTLRTSVIAPDTLKPLAGEDPDPTRVYTGYISVVDILDVPTVSTKGLPISNYSILVSKTGYTVGYQNIFRQDNLASLTPGSFNVFVNGAVPPTSPQFNVVLGWHQWQQNGFKAATGRIDLDLYVWLPNMEAGPGVIDPAQPAKFIVGYGGDAFLNLEGQSTGTMTNFPFARLKREGGYVDSTSIETTTILQRVARSGGTVAANAALPYYRGIYNILATDYGQTIDQDNDGCGDNYGNGFKPIWNGAPGTGGPNYYDPTTDTDCPPNDVSGTLGIPLLGAYYTPYVYVWKDGVVKYYQTSENDFAPWLAEVGSTNPNNCNDHWWKAFNIETTNTSTIPTYKTYDHDNNTLTAYKPLCDDGVSDNPPYDTGFIPYTGYTSDVTTDRLYITGFGK